MNPKIQWWVDTITRLFQGQEIVVAQTGFGPKPYGIKVNPNLRFVEAFGGDSHLNIGLSDGIYIDLEPSALFLEAESCTLYAQYPSAVAPVQVLGQVYGTPLSPVKQRVFTVQSKSTNQQDWINAANEQRNYQ